MLDLGTNRSFNRRPRKVRTLPVGLSGMLALLLVVVPHLLAQTAADAVPDPSGEASQARELTLAEFRSLAASQHSQSSQLSRTTRNPREPMTSADLRQADEVFLELLMIQAREVAANQSIDRLSGWNKSIQSRFQVQSASQLDVDTIQFAEEKMAAESARIERQQARLVERANNLLGRSSNAPLVALLPELSDDPEGYSASLPNDLLARGTQLLGKLYQSYQFGGVPLSTLLWHEQELYRAELHHRLGVARDAVVSVSGVGRQ